MTTYHPMFFNEELHRYTDEASSIYTSVTQLIHKYIPEFKTREVAERCRKSANSKYYGWSVDAILKDWKRITKVSLDIGNNTHNYFEDTVKKSNGYYKDKSGGKGYHQLYTVQDIINNGEKLSDLDIIMNEGLHTKYPKVYRLLEVLTQSGYSIFSEVCTFMPGIISGLVDLLIIKGDEFIIGDWKTGKYDLIPDGLEENKWKSGYFKKDSEGNITDNYIFTNEYLKPPLHYFQNSTYVHYLLQLNIYAYLTTLLTGMKCAGIILCHVNEHRRDINDLATVNLYDIEIMQDSVKELIDDFIRQGSAQTKLQL